jgi:serine/threonine-protein kinase
MALSLLEREAKTLGRIGTHPQIPALLDYFLLDGDFYLVQEFVSGQTLEQEVQEKGIFSEASVKQFLSEMLPILEYLQRQKVIHRDIKPSNILRRSQDKRLVLIDFGAVKDEVQPVFVGAGNTALTSFSIGTPGYAPPEQLALRPVFSSDIYALGATCLYLMTGQKPRDLGFNTETGELLWRKHIQVSEEFARVLGRMLELAVRNRFRTANEVLRAMAMESYTESLSQGLIWPNSAASNDPSRVSPLARFGQQLRSNRQAREGKGPFGDRWSGGNQMGSLGAVRQRPHWTTGDDILRYYQKGQRDFGHRAYNALSLDRATLPRISFHSAQLREASFSQTDLSEATFSYAQLTRANLQAAKLTGAYLNAADLRYANLRGADLSYASLTDARFEETDLRGANLRGAKLTEAQLKQAKTNWRTVLPSGERATGL